MKYEWFETIEEAKSALPYRVVDPSPMIETFADMKLSSWVRWIEPGTDHLAMLFVGLVPDGHGSHLASNILIFTQGHGKKCDILLHGAPKSQNGVFPVADMRDATWGVGVPENGWDDTRPSWASWPSLDGRATYHLEARLMPLGKVRELATQIAEKEAGL